jgi:hypothetical protein
MLEGDPLQRTEQEPPIRTLKIEADGDSWKGRIRPKIRLMGHWLERGSGRVIAFRSRAWLAE